MIKLIVFDFDGTLADSHDLIFEVIKREVEKNGFSLPKGFKEAMGLRRLSKDLQDLGFDGKLRQTVININKEILFNVKKIKPAKDLRKIAKIKKKKIILSNNVEKSIKSFLRVNKINFFEGIYGGESGKNKLEILKKILDKNNLMPRQVVFIGDRESDIHIGKKAGCYTMAIKNGISWGSNREILKSNPDFIVGNLGDIKRVIETLDS